MSGSVRMLTQFSSIPRVEENLGCSGQLCPGTAPAAEQGYPNSPAISPPGGQGHLWFIPKSQNSSSRRFGSQNPETPLVGGADPKIPLSGGTYPKILKFHFQRGADPKIPKFYLQRMQIPRSQYSKFHGVQTPKSQISTSKS